LDSSAGAAAAPITNTDASDEDDKRVLVLLLDSHTGSEEREWAIKLPSK